MNNKLKEWLPIVLIILLVFLARMFVFSPVKVDGHSMDPSLHDGQRLITSKISSLQRQDIITTKEPDDESVYVVKRIIGLPGDRVIMKDDVLTVNGKNTMNPILMITSKNSKKIN